MPLELTEHGIENLYEIVYPCCMSISKEGKKLPNSKILNRPVKGGYTVARLTGNILSNTPPQWGIPVEWLIALMEIA